MQIFLCGRSTTSTSLCVSLSCSSMSFASGFTCTRGRFSSLLKSLTATVSLFLSRVNWIKSVSQCQALSHIFVFIFLEHFEFHVQVMERILRPRNSSKSVLTFTKVYIVGASQFAQGCCSVVGHFRFNFVFWRSEKKNNLILEKRVK